jgi:hypothetical protein
MRDGDIVDETRLPSHADPDAVLRDLADLSGLEGLTDR